MIKKSLTMEQIIAGALLLGFDRLYSPDITLLAKDFLKKNSGYELKDLDWEYIYTGYELIDFDLEHIHKYIKSKDGKITLKDGLTMKSYITESSSNLDEILNQIAGTQIRKYINDLDIEEFVLRKINNHELSEYDFEGLFCDKQQETIDPLYEKGYLTRYWENDCKVTKLSKRGKLRLFKIDYAEELTKFTEKLKSMGYDVNLLDDFLLKQDLELSVWDVLNIENLEQFCNDYDRAIAEPNASGVYSKRLECFKK